MINNMNSNNNLNNNMSCNTVNNMYNNINNNINNNYNNMNNTMNTNISCNAFNNLNNNTFNSMNNIMISNTFNNNINNNMINNNITQSSKDLKCNLFQKFQGEKDAYAFQKGIVLGLNNNQNYQRYEGNGNRIHNFNNFSSSENQSNINNKDIVNIIFSAMKGNIHSRIFNKHDTVKNMLIKFMKSVGLNEYHLDKIYFLFNAYKLNEANNQKKTIEEMGLKNGSKITIIDTKDIIGA